MPFFIVKHVDKTAGVRNSPTQTSSSVFFSHKQYQFRHLNCSPPTPHPPRPDVIQQHGSSHTAGQLAALLDMGTELQDLTHKATAYWSSCIIEVALRAADIRRHSWRSLWVHTLTCPLDHSSNHHTLAHLINIWIKHLFYYHCTLRDNCLHDCVCCRSAQICYVRLTNFHLCTSLCRYSRLSLDTVSHYRKEEEKKKHPVNTELFLHLYLSGGALSSHSNSQELMSPTGQRHINLNVWTVTPVVAWWLVPKVASVQESTADVMWEQRGAEDSGMKQLIQV